EAGQLPFLAALANAFGGGESVRTEPVDEIDAIRQPGPARNGPDRSDPDLAPGRWNHIVVEPRAIHAVERGGLMRLVDDPDRGAHQARPEREPVGKPVVQVRLLDRHLAPRLPSL